MLIKNEIRGENLILETILRQYFHIENEIIEKILILGIKMKSKT